MPSWREKLTSKKHFTGLCPFFTQFQPYLHPFHQRQRCHGPDLSHLPRLRITVPFIAKGTGLTRKCTLLSSGPFTSSYGLWLAEVCVLIALIWSFYSLKPLLLKSKHRVSNFRLDEKDWVTSPGSFCRHGLNGSTGHVNFQKNFVLGWGKSCDLLCLGPLFATVLSLRRWKLDTERTSWRKILRSIFEDMCILLFWCLCSQQKNKSWNPSLFRTIVFDL